MSAAGGSARISVTANKIKYGVLLYTIWLILITQLGFIKLIHLN